MDEAHSLGRGAYMDKNGLQPKSDIMLRHLNRVVELCKKYGIKGAPTLVVTDGEAFDSYYSVPEIKKYIASI